MAVVASAIEAAKQMPIVEYAELLCSQLQPPEALKGVQAAMRHESGQFIWVLQAERFGGFFCFLPDGGLGLLDVQMKPVLRTTKQVAQAVQRTKD
jgi:hypothetical protein